jgi:hypothetical protein
VWEAGGVGRRLVVVAAVAVVAALAWVGPAAPPAAACSCVAPEPGAPVVVFDGTTTEVVNGSRWTVAVDDVVEGDVPGDEVAVEIVHDQPAAGGVVAVSSCSIGAGPEVGGHYRFTVDPVTDGPFHVNLCAGSFTELAAPADGGSATAGTEDDRAPPWGAIVVVGLVAATAIGLVTLKLTSRVALRSRP